MKGYISKWRVYANGFTSGILFCLLFAHVWQDSIGKEAYLKIVESGWQPAGTFDAYAYLIFGAFFIAWPTEVVRRNQVFNKLSEDEHKDDDATSS